MKDMNLNDNKKDSDTANGNAIDSSTDVNTEECLNKNEKNVNSVDNINTTVMADINEQSADTHENGNAAAIEAVNVAEDAVNVAEDAVNVAEDAVSVAGNDKPLASEQDIPVAVTPEISHNLVKNTEAVSSPGFTPKYHYRDDQWSPMNQSGKKAYGIGLLKEIKDDPKSKNKPEVPLLDTCNITRTTPMQEFFHVPNIPRPINDSLFPTFAKGSGMGPRNSSTRDIRKDGGMSIPGGRGGSMKAPGSSGSISHKPVINVRLHDDVKLNKVDSAWKPNRLRQENIDEEDMKTQEVYKKFRGILNKLTPQKFDTLLERIKLLEINNQKRLEGVIDLVFEKAIEEPNFSEAYAALCNKLSKLKVPADNATNPDQFANFRVLIITKCQRQFETCKVDEHVTKLEKELAECTDPAKKKELQVTLAEEQRKIRMRSVGNVRFIGELYKLKMLTSRIMEYCMKFLIDKLEEEKLECLCKLLTTIGEQMENEVVGQLDSICEKMQEIVDKRSNKISSRVRFMMQDVIELRKRKWIAKNVKDSQPKMMHQIQKEAEQAQRHIELMNASPGGGFRRDEGGRNKRGDSRRQNMNNSFNDGGWKPRVTNSPVDTSKLKVGTQKNLTNIKLAPHNSGWNYGSSTKTAGQQAAGSSNSMISISKNMYSMLENDQADPTPIRGARDSTPSYQSKGASIERSTFSSRGDITNDNRSGLATVPRSNAIPRSASSSLATPPPRPVEVQAAVPEIVQEEPLPEDMIEIIKSLIKKFLLHSVVEEFVNNIVDKAFSAKYHVAVIKTIFNIMVDTSPKEFDLIAKVLEQLVFTKVFSPENLLAGMQETLTCAPDLFIDIPMLYENIGNLIASYIIKKHITFADIHKHSESIISSNHGHLLLKAIFKNIKSREGPAVVKSSWQESNMQLKQWMEEDQVAKFMADNDLNYLEEQSRPEVKLFELLKADEPYDHIKVWIKEKIGESVNEDQFMRSLIQAICQYALIDSEGRETDHFNMDRMNKYIGLIQEFGDTKQSREASCLFGIQQLIHRREHPQGLALDIFQYLLEQYIISLDGFVEWEESEKEPEGKAVMLKMLTSFFTNLKEADNEDSCSEE